MSTGHNFHKSHMEALGDKSSNYLNCYIHNYEYLYVLLQTNSTTIRELQEMVSKIPKIRQ